MLQDLKSKADNTYKEMIDWLGARFLKEMERYYSQELFKFLLNTFQNIFLKKLKKKNPFVACKCKQQSDVIV